MQSKRLSAGLAALVGLLFLIAAVLYWTQPAGALPGFLPGHAAAGGPGAADRHIKHGILALALAVCAFVAARFLAAPETPPSAQ